jgi:hypothetical protein
MGCGELRLRERTDFAAGNSRPLLLARVPKDDLALMCKMLVEMQTRWFLRRERRLGSRRASHAC